MRVPRPNPRGRSPRSGFSMLELSICSTILLVAVMGAASAQLDASRLLTQAQQTNVAVGIVQTALDTVLETDLDDLLSGEAAIEIGDEIALDSPLLDNQVVLFDTPGFDPDVDDPPDALEVRVTLNWTSVTGHDRQLALAGILR